MTESRNDIIETKIAKLESNCRSAMNAKKVLLNKCFFFLLNSMRLRVAFARPCASPKRRRYARRTVRPTTFKNTNDSNRAPRGWSLRRVGHVSIPRANASTGVPVRRTFESVINLRVFNPAARTPPSNSLTGFIAMPRWKPSTPPRDNRRGRLKEEGWPEGGICSRDAHFF